MSFLTLTLTSFSGMAGGGVSGTVIGIAHIITTGAGAITATSPFFILMLTQAGGDTTETVIGTGTGGTMNGFLTIDFTRTGSAGKMTDTGKGEEPGASRAISPGHNGRDRN
ncbi:MAG TPA: hypothetical protein VJM83_05205 [Nitrospirota bacterium]|nr:hypothetical protein [Nitrospirota bacterium]